MNAQIRTFSVQHHNISGTPRHSIAVGGFSVMDNHLHVHLRLDPDVAANRSGSAPPKIAASWIRLVSGCRKDSR